MGGNTYSDEWGKVDETVEETPVATEKDTKVEVVVKPEETEISE